MFFKAPKNKRVNLLRPVFLHHCRVSNIQYNVNFFNLKFLHYFVAEFNTTAIKKKKSPKISVP